MTPSTSSQAPASALNPGLTLLSLPKELLTNIALSLDLSSALSLATVCRILLEPAQHRIWSHLDLYIHKNHGEYPLVRPMGHHDPGYCHWAHGAAKEAEKRHRAAVTERINDIMIDSGKTRLRMVKSIKARPRPGANGALKQILGIVAPNLVRLELQPPQHHIFQQQWESNYTTSLFFHMLEFEKTAISFPALTHVTIGKELVIYRNTICQLLNLAPNLRYLDINLASARQDSWAHPGDGGDGQGSTSFMTPPPPVFDGGYTPIRDLRLRSATHGSVPLDRLLDSAQDVIHLELTSPTASNGRRQDILKSFSPGLYDRVSLRLPKDTMGLIRNTNEGRAANAAERLEVDRLSIVASHGTVHFELITIPKIRSLKHLRIEDRNKAAHVDSATVPIGVAISHNAFPEVQPCLPISPYSAFSLSHCRKLEQIDYVPQSFIESTDNWKVEPYPISTWPSTPVRGSIIRSFTSGADELLHVRTYGTFRRVPPGSAEATGPVGMDVYNVKRKDVNGQSYHVRVKEVKEVEWEDATDYKGLVVPLDMIGQMRKVDGKSVEEWQGRGVEVGDEAWKVLTDWAEKQPGFARPALPTAGGPQSGEGVADDQAVKTEPGSGTGVNGNEDEDGEGEDDDEQDDDQEEDDEDEDGNETGASDSESDY